MEEGYLNDNEDSDVWTYLSFVDMKKRVRDLLLWLSDLELWLIFLTQSISRSSTITFITPTLLTSEIDALLICTNFKMCRKNIRLKNSSERIWYFSAEWPTYFHKSITHPVEFFSLKVAHLSVTFHLESLI